MDALMTGRIAAGRLSFPRIARRLPTWWGLVSTRTRVLTAVWAVFIGLVSAGVHGSSIAKFEEVVAPGAGYSRFVMGRPGCNVDGSSRDDLSLRRTLLMMQPRTIRSDEYLLWTPYALSQLAHRPRFPVVNELLPGGQNMLLIWNAPVAHPTLLARPVTWGYFLFGEQRGLAWQWWFPPFACFTVLWLLFEVVLPGRSGLAAFGAVWFCISGHTVAWSLMPAHDTFFAALCCLTAYYLMTSKRLVRIGLNAFLLGLGMSGLVMVLYPPWQVLLGHIFGLIFLGLVWRDRDIVRAAWSNHRRLRITACVGAVGLAAGLLAFWANDCSGAMQAMAATSYPGQRACAGGNFALVRLFSGWFGFAALYGPYEFVGDWRNQSEAASFYHFFPAAIFGMVLMPTIRRSVGLIGWLIAAFLGLILLYGFAGLPMWLVRTTLLSWTHGYRIDLAIGLCSIILTLLVLARDRSVEQPSPWGRIAPWLGGAMMGVIVLAAGKMTRLQIENLLSRSEMLAAAAAVGIATVALLAGRRRLFIGLVGTAAIATGAFYNPLARGTAAFHRSELAAVIAQLNAEAGDQPPLWLSYGGRYTGHLISVRGGRTFTGIAFHPMEVWRDLDPTGVNVDYYNRFAHIRFIPEVNGSMPRFSNPHPEIIEAVVPWDHPAFLKRGLRYVLLEAELAAVVSLDDPRLRLRHRSARNGFAIYEVMPAS